VGVPCPARGFTVSRLLARRRRLYVMTIIMWILMSVFVFINWAFFLGMCTPSGGPVREPASA
jgi:hypothetical protein